MALKSGRVGIHPSQVDPITGMLLAGPGGTTDYTQLTNKPQINNVTLSGNKSLSDLGIATSFDTLSDSDINNPEAGQILVYNGTGWENEFSSVSPTTLSALQDVAISSASNDQILRYNSISEKWENEDMPAIPAAQVNSDWNATSGVAEILNKPTIPAAQVNSDWNAASGVAQILNKPTIPTNVSDLTNGYVWTSGVSALAGATTATITDANITANSTIEVFASVQGIQEPTLAVSSGSCVLTFTALTQNTTFKLRITN